MTYERHWHKRVPYSMAKEYMVKGWEFFSYEDAGKFVVLIWPHEGLPP